MPSAARQLTSAFYSKHEVTEYGGRARTEGGEVDDYGSRDDAEVVPHDVAAVDLWQHGCSTIISQTVWSRSPSITGSAHKKTIAAEIQHDGRRGAECLIPYVHEVSKIRIHASRVVRINDPHFLPKNGLRSNEDGVEKEENGAEKEEVFVGGDVFPFPAEHNSDRHEVQHEFHAWPKG